MKTLEQTSKPRTKVGESAVERERVERPQGWSVVRETGHTHCEHCKQNLCPPIYEVLYRKGSSDQWHYLCETCKDKVISRKRPQAPARAV